MKGVSIGGANQGQRRAGAAAGVFDDGIAGTEAAVGFGAGDDGDGHAVLHAAGWVLPLELGQDIGVVGRDDFMELD
jgi:hypothetical protein